MISHFSISIPRKVFFLQKHIFRNNFLKNHFYKMKIGTYTSLSLGMCQTFHKY